MKRKFNKKNIYSIDFKIANRTKYYIKCIFFIINYITNSIFCFYPCMNLSHSKLGGFTDSINKI